MTARRLLYSAAVAAATVAFAMTLPDAALTTLESRAVVPVSLQDSAFTLLRLMHRAGGVAVVTGCDDLAAAPLGNALSLTQALKQVAGAVPGYRVLDTGDAIDLLPPRGATAGLLSTPIDRFDYDGPKYAALYAVQLLPAVASAVRRIAPQTVYGGGIGPKGTTPSVHVHLGETDLLGALNAVAVAEHGGIWFVELRRCRGASGATIQLVSDGQ